MKFRPKVWNMRDKSRPEDAVYVGRPSKWGNPFLLTDPLLPSVPPEEKRCLVIEEYEKYLYDKPKLLEALPELKGKDLVCYCAPKPCHADVLLRLANKEKPSKEEGEQK